MLKSYLNLFCTTFFVFMLILCLLHALPLNMQKSGILGQQLNISHIIKSKVFDAASHAHQYNLMVNFIGNERHLSFKEALALQNSGLVHLLAISGAQIMPIVGFIVHILSMTFFLF